MTKASVTLASADRGKLYRSPMQVRHGFASNELFRLDRLVELARSMPRDRIEYNSGDVPPGVKGMHRTSPGSKIVRALAIASSVRPPGCSAVKVGKA